jgi:hypothetical protein
VIRRFTSCMFCAASIAASQNARAQDQEALPYERDESQTTHGMAEFGVGLLSLPGATVCVAEVVGCSKGDSSLAVSAWQLFRRGPFAAGAGVMLGLTSSTDAPRNDPEEIPRDHTRKYFSVEITARYYLPLTERLDGWAGVTSGLGVVNDTFQSQKGLSERALVGPRGVTILTEGFTLGVGAGVAYAIAQNWRFGGGMRVSRWFLPEEAQKDPLGDEASLKGGVTTVDLGITLAYRSRLVF